MSSLKVFEYKGIVCQGQFWLVAPIEKSVSRHEKGN